MVNFSIGDHIQISGGAHKGASGKILGDFYDCIESHFYIVSLDQAASAVAVHESHLVLLSTKTFQVGDRVELVNAPGYENEFGYVLGTEEPYGRLPGCYIVLLDKPRLDRKAIVLFSSCLKSV